MLLKRVFAFFAVVIALALTIKLFNFSTEKMERGNEELEVVQEQNYSVYAPQIPANFDFAGEAVPLNNFTVYERFDKEILKNTYFHSNTILYFKRAYRFFPIIEPILKEQGIPDDFKYLALIESGLENVISPAGAAGYWQFMKKTAQSYGLEVSTEVDERFHLEKSTYAACKYLKDAHGKFGNWTLVAASYNMGMGGVSKKIENQGTNSYYDLVLNSETSRYVYRILALKSIFEQPQQHGFYLSEQDLYPVWDVNVIDVDTVVDSWIDFAKEHHVSYRVLKDLNPWLRRPYLKNLYAKTYGIKLPNESMMQTMKEHDKRSSKIGVFGDL